MVWIILIIILAVILLAALWALNGRKEPRRFEAFQNTPIAHRGFHHKPTVPENSMAAFRAAVDRDYGIELDVHLLKDGGLAIIHDHELARTTGQQGIIENLTTDELKNYALEASREPIPTFQEFLQLVDGKVPLVIELKCKGNAPALCRAVLKALEGYQGPYCIESFDPRPLIWLRRHRPEITRGQLTQNFMKDPSGLKLPTRILLTALSFNLFTRPDFVAIKFRDRNGLENRICHRFWKVQGFTWTIKKPEDYQTATEEGYLCIFEQFEAPSPQKQNNP